MGELTLNVKLSKPDLMRAFLFTTARSGMIWSVAAVVGLAVYIGFERALPGILMAIGAALLFLALIVCVGYINAVRNPCVLDAIRYEISDEAFSAVLSKANVSLQWSIVKRAIETSRYLLVRVGRGYYVIPKAQITGDELTQLRTLFGQKLGRRARLKR